MVYSDVVNGGYLLTPKSFYTLRDYRTLLKKGFKPKTARFICICSAVYYGVEYSKAFNSLKIRVECGIA